MGKNVFLTWLELRHTRASKPPLAVVPRIAGECVSGRVRRVRDRAGGTRRGLCRVVFNALEKMLEAGLLIADPPRAEWERGGRVRYSVNGELVSLLHLQLGQALRIL